MRKLKKHFVQNPELLQKNFGHFISHFIEKANTSATEKERFYNETIWQTIDRMYDYLTEEEKNVSTG